MRETVDFCGHLYSLTAFPLPFPSPDEISDDRLAIVKELLRSEDTYLENLKNIFDIYMEPLKWVYYNRTGCSGVHGSVGSGCPCWCSRCMVKLGVGVMLMYSTSIAFEINPTDNGNESVSRIIVKVMWLRWFGGGWIQVWSIHLGGNILA